MVDDDEFQASSAEHETKKTLKIQGDPSSDQMPTLEDGSDIAAHVEKLDELLKSTRKPDQKPAASSGGTGSSEVVTANGMVPGIATDATLQDGAKDGELSPYTSSLEYLDDSFQELALKLQIAKARHKEDMKEALNDERPWYDRSSKVGSTFCEVFSERNCPSFLQSSMYCKVLSF